MCVPPADGRGNVTFGLRKKKYSNSQSIDCIEITFQIIITPLYDGNIGNAAKSHAAARTQSNHTAQYPCEAGKRREENIDNNGDASSSIQHHRTKVSRANSFPPYL